MHIFTNGLLPDLRNFTILSQPKSFEDAVAAAKVRSTIQPSTVSSISSQEMQNFKEEMLGAISKANTQRPMQIAAFEQTPDKAHESLTAAQIRTMIQNEVRRNSRPTNNNNLRFNTRTNFW